MRWRITVEHGGCSITAAGRNLGCVKFSAEELTTNFASGPWAEKYPPILTIAQAADLLQVPVGTLRSWRTTGRRAGREYERIGARVSIFLNKRVWYANWQEGPKQQRKTLRTRNHDGARQTARALEGQLSAAAPPAGRYVRYRRRRAGDLPGGLHRHGR